MSDTPPSPIDPMHPDPLVPPVPPITPGPPLDPPMPIPQTSFETSAWRRGPTVS